MRLIRKHQAHDGLTADEVFFDQLGEIRKANQLLRQAQLAREALPKLTQLLGETTIICEHTLGPRQHPFTFGREASKPRPALPPAPSREKSSPM